MASAASIRASEQAACIAGVTLPVDGGFISAGVLGTQGLRRLDAMSMKTRQGDELNSTGK